MSNSALTWYIETDKGFIPTNDYYAGSYGQGETISLIIYLWNNRWGTEDVSDIVGLTLKLYFDKLENSVLLPNFMYSVDGDTFAALRVDNNIGYINLAKTISGTKNDGSLEANPNNYIKIRLTIPVIEGITENLKQLYISPLFDNGGAS